MYGLFTWCCQHKGGDNIGGCMKWDNLRLDFIHEYLVRSFLDSFFHVGSNLDLASSSLMDATTTNTSKIIVVGVRGLTFIFE